MWFVCAAVTMIAWGVADLFYKKGADENDHFSHIKTSMIVGFIMGGHAIGTLLITGIDYDPVNLVKYLPVSFMYILSMTIGYFGLRYLELSISSPIQNSSGAVTCLLCLVFLHKALDGISAFAVVIICVGIFFLGLLEHRAVTNARRIQGSDVDDRRYRIGLVAFFMPILYCIIDALGTFFDAWYLDDIDTTPLVGVTEDTLETVANVSYELTFLICGVIILIFLLVKRSVSKDTSPVSSDRTLTLSRILAAVFETAGQATYVYAMSGNGAVAAPMVASFSIVSLILSRIFLKERLTKLQYAAVTAVMIGIAMLGLEEGLG